MSKLIKIILSVLIVVSMVLSQSLVLGLSFDDNGFDDNGRAFVKILIPEDNVDLAKEWLRIAKETGEQWIEWELSKTFDEEKISLLEKALAESKGIDINGYFMFEDTDTYIIFPFGNATVIVDNRKIITTDANGYYSLNGINPESNISITKDGIELVSDTIIDNNSEISIELTFEEMIENIDMMGESMMESELVSFSQSSSTMSNEPTDYIDDNTSEILFTPFANSVSENLPPYNESDGRFSGRLVTDGTNYHIKGTGSDKGEGEEGEGEEGGGEGEEGDNKENGTGYMRYVNATSTVPACQKVHQSLQDGILAGSNLFSPLPDSDCGKSVALGAIAIGPLELLYHNSIYCFQEATRPNKGNPSFNDTNSPDYGLNVYCNARSDYMSDNKDLSKRTPKNGRYNCSWFSGIGHTEELHIHSKLYLNISKDKWSINENAQSTTIKVDTNYNYWDISSSNADWLTISPNPSTNPRIEYGDTSFGELTLSVSENTSNAPRTAIINITTGSATGEFEKTIIVNQKAKKSDTNVRYNVLLLDISDSMNGDPFIKSKVAAIKYCETVLQADGENYIAIVPFSTTASIALDFSNNINDLKSTINGLTIGEATNTNSALQIAGYLLDGITNSNSIKNIVLLSDGVPVTGSSSSSGRYTYSDAPYYINGNYVYAYANAVYNTSRQLTQKYSLYSLAFFHDDYYDIKLSEFGRKLLKDIQNAGYYDVTNVDDLDFAFGDIGVGSTNNGNKRIIRINCPVDIQVFNANRDIVASIINDLPQTIVNSSIIVKVDENDQKIIYLPGNAEYYIEVTARENCKITYSISEEIEDEDTIIRVINYFDIELTAHEKIIGQVENLNTVADALYKLTFENGDEITPSEDLKDDSKLRYNVSVNINGYGSVTGVGTKTKGEFVKLTARPTTGYTFKGWFDGDDKVSGDIEYRFCVLADVILTANFDPSSYTLTIDAAKGGKIILGNSGNYDYTAMIPLSVEPEDGYRFKNWMSSNGGTFTSDTEMVTLFIMPANDTIVTANFEYIGTSGGGNSGGNWYWDTNTPTTTSSDSNSTSSTSTTSGTMTTDPAPETPKPVVKINGISIIYTIDAKGNVVLTPTQAQMKKIIENAKSGVLEIDIGTLTGVLSMSLDFNISWIPKTIKSIKIFDKNLGSYEIKYATLTKLNGKITLVLKKGSLITDILVDDKAVSITDYANPMIVSIPYKLKSGELASQIVMMNKTTGKVIPRSYYKNGYVYAIVYSTGHFEPACVKLKTFNDTVGTWSDESVKYMNTHGVINGMTETTFEPNTKVTRAQYITMLVRLLDLTGIDYSETEPFSDINRKDSYYSVIMQARTLGITNGIGDNKFGRDLPITLEDMYTMTYRAMKQFGMVKDFDKTKSLGNYADGDKVSSYAVEAIQNFLQNDIVKSEVNLNPKVTASRAITALLMYRLLLSEK